VIVTGERLFSSTGRKEVLAKVESRDLRTAITQLYEVLDQSVAAQGEARLLMLRAAQAFSEIKLLRTAPGVGPIGACRFSAYIHTPSRFSSKRKLWKYCRLSVSHRSSNGKPLRRRFVNSPPKSITTLAVLEISVLDFDFHTRFVGWSYERDDRG
jgi:transposase